MTDTDAIRSGEDARPGSYRPLVAAILVVAGMSFGLVGDGRLVAWTWLGVAAVGLAVWMVARRMAPPVWPTGVAALSLGLATLALAAARMSSYADQVARSDLTAYIRAGEELWRLEGRIRTPPVIKTASGGSMAKFGHQGPLTYFQFEVESAHGDAASTQPMTGAVLVRVAEPVYHWRVGDRMIVEGMLSPFPSARNEGEFDRNRLARVQGLAGILESDTRRNVVELGFTPTFDWRWRRWRAAIRDRAAGWILQDLTSSPTARRDALLAALLLGDRGPGLSGLDQAFQRIGLAHLLSISGLHLTMLALVATLVLRGISRSTTLERLALILLIVSYLLLLPGRIPVWRAGVMMIAFLLADLTGRRMNSVNVLALAAIALLAWRPSELLAPGFQLSFGVVLALITLTEPMREKLFGEREEFERLSAPEMLWSAVKTTIAATLVAWVISLPLVAYHFGIVCPLAPVISLAALPLIGVILPAGYIKALTAVAFPSVGVLLAPVLSIFTDGLIGLVVRLDELPLSSIVVGHPSLGWTTIATLAAAWIIVSPAPRRRARWVRSGVVAAIAVWLTLPSWSPVPRFERDAARLTMLAVGNGSCYVIESRGEAAIFDAGSGSYFAIGDTLITPTLRRQGILRVRTMILSHADIDHFAAAVEVMASMGVRELLVTPPMIDQADADPLSPVATLLDETALLGVTVRVVSAGHRMNLGDATLEWLAPEEGTTHSTDNDSSAVIRIEAAGRAALLTGDIAGQAMERLTNEASSQIRADILELPHHGSWSEDAVEFVDLVNPEIILQSTGHSRLRLDRWAARLSSRQRFVSAWAGTTTVHIRSDGQLVVETFRDADPGPRP
ncbi:MAG: ComEC/Rec2 family competence protein [Phycisphaerales bacterium]